MNGLSDTKIRNAKPADKEYIIADGQGLSIMVRPSGTKLWLYRYRFGSKRKNMSFGTFPGVGLKTAREKRHDAEKLLDQGQDPAAVREAKRSGRQEAQAHLSRRRGGMGDQEARKGEQGQSDDQAGTLESRSALP